MHADPPESNHPPLVYLRLLAAYMREGHDMAAAAVMVCRRHANVARKTIEIIGSWPSSEPEFRALQRAF